MKPFKIEYLYISSVQFNYKYGYEMKKVFWVILCSCFSINNFAQGIDFKKITYEEAVDKAIDEEKLVLILVRFSNDPFASAMESIYKNKEIADYYNTHFINMDKEIDIRNPEDMIFLKDFEIKSSPSYIYLNAEYEQIIAIYNGRVDRSSDFLEQAKVAVEGICYGLEKIMEDYPNDLSNIQGTSQQEEFVYMDIYDSKIKLQEVLWQHTTRSVDKVTGEYSHSAYRAMLDEKVPNEEGEELKEAWEDYIVSCNFSNLNPTKITQTRNTSAGFPITIIELEGLSKEFEDMVIVLKVLPAVMRDDVVNVSFDILNKNFLHIDD